MASIAAIRLPGYWLHEPGTPMEVGVGPKPGEKVIYALHGGGYTSFSAHPGAPTSSIPMDLLTFCEGVERAFSLEYRLSVGPLQQPSYPFPTALIDALAGYNYLVNVVGFSSNNVIVVGDSAGGNLALALARYLIEHQSMSLPPPPGALVLASPWADSGFSHVKPDSSTYTNLDSDIVSEDEILYSMVALTSPHGLAATAVNEYISPGSKDIQNVSFVGFPKTFIISGGAETLRDQCRTLYNRMAKDIGSDVVHHEARDAIHNFLCFDFFEPQRSETLQMIGKWLSTL